MKQFAASGAIFILIQESAVRGNGTQKSSLSRLSFLVLTPRAVAVQMKVGLADRDRTLICYLLLFSKSLKA